MILQSLLLIVIIIVITDDSNARVRSRYGDDADITIKDYGKHYDGLVVKGIQYHHHHHHHHHHHQYHN